MHDLPADLESASGSPLTFLKSPGRKAGGEKAQSKLNQSLALLLNKRIIAFPVHASGGASGWPHWTLGIVVNRKWEKSEEVQIQHDWILFHFDTMHCNDDSELNAVKVATFITQSNSNIKLIDIPVPKQPSLSNDCGLYPAHFLKIFLSNINRSIEECTAVSV